MWLDTDMTTTTATQIPVTIDGRNYTIHTDSMGTTCLANIYRITGTRGADGALCVHHTGKYEGRVVAVGISHLERLNWWDLRNALTDLGLGVK